MDLPSARNAPSQTDSLQSTVKAASGDQKTTPTSAEPTHFVSSASFVFKAPPQTANFLGSKSSGSSPGSPKDQKFTFRIPASSAKPSNGSAHSAPAKFIFKIPGFTCLTTKSDSSPSFGSSTLSELSLVSPALTKLKGDSPVCVSMTGASWEGLKREEGGVRSGRSLREETTPPGVTLPEKHYTVVTMENKSSGSKVIESTQIRAIPARDPGDSLLGAEIKQVPPVILDPSPPSNLTCRLDGPCFDPQSSSSNLGPAVVPPGEEVVKRINFISVDDVRNIQSKCSCSAPVGVDAIPEVLEDSGERTPEEVDETDHNSGGSSSGSSTPVLSEEEYLSASEGYSEEYEDEEDEDSEDDSSVYDADELTSTLDDSEEDFMTRAEGLSTISEESLHDVSSPAQLPPLALPNQSGFKPSQVCHTPEAVKGHLSKTVTLGRPRCSAPPPTTPSNLSLFLSLYDLF